LDNDTGDVDMEIKEILILIATILIATGLIVFMASS